MIPGKTYMTLLIVLALLCPLALLACHGEGGGGTSVSTYSVTVINLTANQPLSPMGVVLHKSGYSPWELGETASAGLEQLAEGGENSGFLAEADADPNVLITESGSGAIGPGSSETVTISTVPTKALLISVATMLVNTNDAFTGLKGEIIGTMVRGQSMSFEAGPYDAGTEANTETFSTIPGPAGLNGVGFSATRDDRDFVSVHAGAVTSDDGLSTSALRESHRFQGPVAKIVVTRLM